MEAAMTETNEQAEAAKDASPAPPASLHDALVRFQEQAPRITKNATAKVEAKTGAKFEYDYVTLAHLSEEVLPVLAKLGLVWITMPTHLEGRPMLAYRLEFQGQDGPLEVIESMMPLMMTSGSPQDLGGAITYMRRYALCAVLGLAPDKDDDAAPKKAKNPKKVTKAVALAIAKGAEQAGVLTTLQLAASHVVGDDIGSCETVAEATKALEKLSGSEAARVADWVAKKEREALDA
jgi:hypothetical protein